MFLGMGPHCTRRRPRSHLCRLPGPGPGGAAAAHGLPVSDERVSGAPVPVEVALAAPLPFRGPRTVLARGMLCTRLITRGVSPMFSGGSKGVASHWARRSVFWLSALRMSARRLHATSYMSTCNLVETSEF